MLVDVKAYWLTKAGNSPADYEDAFWPKAGCYRATHFRLAVSDGATESAFAAPWARLLARAYACSSFDIERIPHAISRLRKSWSRRVGNRELSWYAEAKLREGASSTVVRLSLFDNLAAVDGQGQWQALAVGDSCLFQTRDGFLLKSFPCETPTQFTSRPSLLCSVSGDNSEKAEDSGFWILGDVFYLMTDALACWFLASQMCSENPIEVVQGIKSQSDFDRFVGDKRQEIKPDGLPALKNDDVTLVACSILEA